MTHAADTADTADNTDGADHFASAASAHSPRLLWMLGASVILHAAVIGLWPDATGAHLATAPATRITLKLQHETAAHAAITPTVAAATAAQASKQRRSKAAAKSTPRNNPAPARAAVTSNEAIQPQQNAATHAAAQTTTQAIDSNELRKQLNRRLQHALIAHFDYPPIARRRGWEGVVQVGVRVEANGLLSRVRLIATSGYASLDRAAIKSLGDIVQLRDSADWLNGQPVDMILPIRYQLIES